MAPRDIVSSNRFRTNLSVTFEEFHGVAGRIFQQNLFVTLLLDDFVALTYRYGFV